MPATILDRCLGGIHLTGATLVRGPDRSSVCADYSAQMDTPKMPLPMGPSRNFAGSCLGLHLCEARLDY